MRTLHLPRGPIGLRWYLTALIAGPLLICGSLTTVLIAQQVGDATTADRAAVSVRTAGRLQAVQIDLEAELIPAMALRITNVPLLRKIVGLGPVGAVDVAISDTDVSTLRKRTDAAVARLGAVRGQADVAARTRTGLRTLRRDIDSGQRLPDGFFAAVSLADRLATTSRAVLRRGRPTNDAAAIVSAVRDATLVGSAARAGAAELGYLAALKFPGLGAVASTERARAAWLESWASFTAASRDLVRRADPASASAWRTALSAPLVADYSRRLAAFAADPTLPLDVPMLVTLLRGDEARSAAIGRLSGSVASRALAVATAARAAALRRAALVAGMVALGMLLSVLVAVLVRRRIARPLAALSREAGLVSRGELVDVTSIGPREIRTVGAGLAAAVASLRRIEAQAGAVARGELHSELVREPLPGPLGSVVHSSVATIIGALQERDRAQSDLIHQATHDALTGLPNRNQALVSIAHALQRGRRRGALTALLYVDLDLFKAVNDTFGHAAGDEVLRVCADRMSEVVRDTDMVYRLGGDEFVVLLEDVSRDFPFVVLADRMIDAISQPIALADATTQVGASIGISLSQDASVDAERLLGEADAAAYSAKSAGRGRVGVFDQALRDALTERSSIEDALSRALERGELVLHYQPVVEMGTARPIGYEALVRWRHPTRGLVAPGEFIPVAEKSVLINRIGRWSLHEATAQLARWDADGGHPSSLSVAVNISGRHLVTTELMTDVQDALAASRLDARRLVVEITETVLVDDPVALDNMQRLRELGVVVAIDDFGTGYTSIGQLPKLPVDVLKIDRSFTSNEKAGHFELVRLIVGAAHAFGLTVVAEGIEEAGQAASLTALAVDTGQGFFYARPQPAVVARELAGLERLPREPEQDPAALG